MPAWFSEPVIANRHETSRSSGQSIAAIIVRLVILRFASSNAAMISAPVSRGSEVRNSSKSSRTATAPLIVWMRSSG